MARHQFPQRRRLLLVLALVGAMVAGFLLWYYWPLARSLACGRAHDPLTCIQDVLAAETLSRGVDAAYDTFQQLYAVSPSFILSCHYAEHAIGESAYMLYARGETIPARESFSYCGFGFYHGLMIALLTATHDPRGAYGFCTSQTAGMASSSALAQTTHAACMHGFGHGISEFETVTDWSDPLAAIQPELDICKRISANAAEQSMCAGGVFNSLGEKFLELSTPTEPYPQIIDMDHPFALCEAQVYAPFREACLRDFNSVIVYMNSAQFAPGAAQVAAISDHADAAIAMENYTDFLAKFLLNDPTRIREAAAECHALRADLVEPCMQGFVKGLMEFSTPDREYESVIVLCDAPALTESGRRACYQWLVRSGGRYPDPIFNAMCAAIPVAYRDLCTDSTRRQ